MPEEFGLIGMIAIVLAIGTELMKGGMGLSLIRTSKPNNNDYSTVFWINLLTSVVIYLLIYFLAPLVADFYNTPILTKLIRILSIRILLGALTIVQRTKLIKEMNFKSQFKIQLPSLLISGATGIYFALNGYGVWSLVLLQLIRDGLIMIQYWLYASWWPLFSVNIPKLKYHFNFGYKHVISGLIHTAYENLYLVLIGKYFPVEQLGFYTRANSTKQLPISNITSAINSVTYPMFAEINKDNERLKHVYTLVMQQVLFWIAPLLFIAIVIAEPLFIFVFTEKWLPAVPYFQLLCIVGILQPLSAYNLDILNIKGRSDLFLKLEIIKKSYVIVGLFIALPYGIMALIYLQIIASIIGYFINSYYSGKFINFSVFEQIRKISPILLLSMIMGFICFGIHRMLFIKEFSDFSRVILVFVCGMSFYLVSAFLLKMSPYIEFVKILKRKK